MNDDNIIDMKYTKEMANKNLLLSKFMQLCLNETDTPKDMQDIAKQAVSCFDECVGIIASPFYMPNKALNKLGKLFWRLVGNKITPAALTNMDLPGLHVWTEKHNSGSSVFAVMVPVNWVKSFNAEPFMQLGGMVYTASQAADYWHGKLNKQSDAEAMISRAWAYEAEYLLSVGHSLKSLNCDFKYNSYQQKVLDRYPLGLASLEVENRYSLKPYVPNDFDEIENFYAKKSKYPLPSNN